MIWVATALLHSLCPSNSGKKQQDDPGKDRALCWEPPYSGNLCGLLSKTWSLVYKTPLPGPSPLSSFISVIAFIKSILLLQTQAATVPQTFGNLGTSPFSVSLLKILEHGSRCVEMFRRLWLPQVSGERCFLGPSLTKPYLRC